MITIETVTTIEGFLAFENVWNKLLEKCRNENLCLTFEWFSSWLAGFGTGKSLFVLVIRKGGAIIGFAPLMITHTRYRNLPASEIGFIQNDYSPSADFIISESQAEAISAVVDYLLALQNWDVISLRNLPKDSPNYGTLVQILAQKGIIYGTGRGLCSPFIKIQTDWETFMSSRTRKFRKAIRNKMNRIKKCGTYDIKIVDKIDGDNNVLEHIFAISKNSWKADYDKDIVSSDNNMRFFTALSKTAARKGWLKIWLLNVNGKPVAYEYHLAYKGRLHALRSDYDRNYRLSSPGSILDLHIVENAFSGQVTEYDMCGSSDFYKLNWTSDIREHARVLIFRDTVYGRMLYFLEFKVISLLKKYEPVKKLRDAFLPQPHVRH
ncbi:MAG: hypothetical protein A2293_15015 [Elusimicrobia bacterium RIFOXYB2_FULL_49_7]|nr:MAG: hypothetical protein A2293_15015 [Elusimicrobia bacterium RIFOXYB2_FULL_49_7]